MTRALYGGRPDRDTRRLLREEATRRRNQSYLDRSRPSALHNRPRYRMSIPPGCTDVYRVSQWDGRTSRYHGIYYNEAEAYEKADKVWADAIKSDRVKVTVEHKAAIELGGKLYLVNLVPITMTEAPVQVAALLRTPEVDQ